MLPRAQVPSFRHGFVPAENSKLTLSIVLVHDLFKGHDVGIILKMLELAGCLVLQSQFGFGALLYILLQDEDAPNLLPLTEAMSLKVNEVVVVAEGPFCKLKSRFFYGSLRSEAVQ